MRKYLVVCLAVLLGISILSACGRTKATEVAGQSSVSGEASSDDALKIVVTIFPEYDWVKQILGENSNAEVKMLLDNGVDLHSYQPSVDDIISISECDLFVYVGGESDEWVEDALAEGNKTDRRVINLLEVLGDQVKAEEVVEGMEAEHDHDHDHDDADDDHDHEDADKEHEDHDHEDADEEHEDHDHEDADEDHHDHDHEEEEEEMDEHVWLSLRNASAICEAIAGELGQIDPANNDTYMKNLKSYQEELAKLDQEYTDAVNGAKTGTLLFADRFPFRYLVDDYSLNYYAAFVGCSAETEASFQTILFLANKVDELKLSAILTIEGADHKIAETVRSSTEKKDQKILSMDSMQGTTSKDVADGKTYLSIMKANLDVLKEAIQ